MMASPPLRLSQLSSPSLTAVSTSRPRSSSHFTAVSFSIALRPPVSAMVAMPLDAARFDPHRQRRVVRVLAPCVLALRALCLPLAKPGVAKFYALGPQQFVVHGSY